MRPMRTDKRFVRLRDGAKLPGGLAQDFERELREMLAVCQMTNFRYDATLLAMTVRDERWTREEALLAEELLKEYDCWKGFW